MNAYQIHIYIIYNLQIDLCMFYNEKVSLVQYFKDIKRDRLFFLYMYNDFLLLKKNRLFNRIAWKLFFIC